MNKELTPLEALEEIKRQVGNIHYFDFTQNIPTMTTIPLVDTLLFKIVENALKRLKQLEEEKQSFDRAIEKKLKALEIIKEKRVDVGWLISCENIKQYNGVIGTATHKLLTQEEYDLLKEVLDD